MVFGNGVKNIQAVAYKARVVLQKMMLSQNGFIISCSANLITKIKMIKLIFDIEN